MISEVKLFYKSLLISLTASNSNFDYDNVQSLERLVIVESVAVFAILLTFFFVYKLSRSLAISSFAVVTGAFFYAWNPVTALATCMIYTSFYVLFWQEVAKRKQGYAIESQLLPLICWPMLILGVMILISLKVIHILNIFS